MSMDKHHLYGDIKTREHQILKDLGDAKRSKTYTVHKNKAPF